jgi:transcription-repair coupling factor (superfamily II helicase)
VIAGAAGALPGLVLAAASAEFPGPILLVTADEKSAETVAADAMAFGLSGVFVAPEASLTPYQRVAPSLKYRKAEFSLLSSLVAGSCRLAAVPARFLFARLPRPASFRSRRLGLAKGAAREIGSLIAFLAREGYRKTDLVLETGDFAVRGGLVDLFAPDSARPCRVEFDGDEIASIRTFDPDTQRSEARLEEMVVAPMSPIAESPEADELLEKRLGRASSAAERSLFLAAVSGETATLFEYFEAGVVALFEPELCGKALEDWRDRIEADYNSERDPIPPDELCHSLESIQAVVSARAEFAFDRAGLFPGEPLGLSGQEAPSFEGRVAEAAAEIRRLVGAGERMAVAVAPHGGPEKIARFAAEYGLEGLEILTGRISAGFRLRSARLTLSSEEQIFGPERTPLPSRRRASEAFVSDLRDLKGGDYVVHADYGVGRFRGLKRIPVEGSEREFVEIAYSDEKVLLLPVERLDLVQKYSGAEGVEPKIDRLGGASWGRRKEAVRKAVKDLSEELLRLYAKRAEAQGFAFSKDSPWQKEFEDAFEYTETPDQAQAILDVKRDMEKASPMDRLLCGDVGYGKTEVAMRAAFKAVLDGKQVAVLAPTTILADQHYRTFTRRFAAFPVSIELLSRFRSREEQKRIVRDVAEGTADILIATHRMLSRDIRFRDLGLLVVDEEQRFGVAQKERVKEWKTSVDVLSMSATPIPRSLNFSLSGIRDLSIIETPPRNRLAIETQIIPKNPDLVREAISFELARGGQVFYIHNRVETIEAEKTFLAELLPGARIVVGHGQMGEGQLEKTMLDFVSRKHDILLATTILENGIDIPSVNTIVIDRAGTFGLSQLYQLRGRVGRSDKAAYCYLVVEAGAALTETARQRLATIREFCDLGAGFRIAAKDLEIRGAGNFLGAEQSGHIAAVGLEMYLDLLEQAVRGQQGEEAPPERSVNILLGHEISIPASYLPDESLRLALYKRIARARNDEEIFAIARETEDRFGSSPAPVLHLFEYARLRRRAERLGLRSLEKKGAVLRLVFEEAFRAGAEKLVGAARGIGEARLVSPGVVALPAGFPVPALLRLLDLLAVPVAA